MKKKNLIKLAILASTLLIACGGKEEVSSSSSHQHEFIPTSIVWTWMKSSIGYDASASLSCGCGETRVFDADVSLKPYAASCTTKTEKTYVATILVDGNEYSDTKSIEVSPSGHSASKEWITSADGHYQICENCQEPINQGTHEFGKWNVTEEADYGKAGSQERVCSTCGYKETATIDPIVPSINEVQTQVNAAFAMKFPYSYDKVCDAINLSSYLSETDQGSINHLSDIKSLKTQFESDYVFVSQPSNRTVDKKDDDGLGYAGTWNGQVSKGNDNTYGEVDVLDIKSTGSGWGGQGFNGISFTGTFPDVSEYKELSFAIYNPSQSSSAFYLFTNGWYFVPSVTTHAILSGWNEYTFTIKNGGYNGDSAVNYSNITLDDFSIVITNNQVNDGWKISSFVAKKYPAYDAAAMVELINTLPTSDNLDKFGTFKILDKIDTELNNLSEEQKACISNISTYNTVKAAYDAKYSVIYNPRLNTGLVHEGSQGSSSTLSVINDDNYGPVLKINASYDVSKNSYYHEYFYSFPKTTFGTNDILDFYVRSDFPGKAGSSLSFWTGTYSQTKYKPLDSNNYIGLSGTGSSFEESNKFANSLNATGVSFVNFQRYHENGVFTENYSGNFYLTAIIATKVA